MKVVDQCGHMTCQRGISVFYPSLLLFGCREHGPDFTPLKMTSGIDVACECGLRRPVKMMACGCLWGLARAQGSGSESPCPGTPRQLLSVCQNRAPDLPLAKPS